jgi:hypothetical protein
MKTVQKIIEAHGGIEALRNRYIRIENKPYMPLVIEYIGTTPIPVRVDEHPRPFRLPMISVAHYGTQNGDAMRDPEMVFHVHVLEGRIVSWTPRYWRNDYAGLEQEVFTEKAGKLLYKPKLLRQLRSFAIMWDRNICQQGFLKAYDRAEQKVNFN